MTTRCLRSQESIALRSNRKLPPPPPPPPRQKIPQSISSPQTPQSQSIQNLQEIAPKIQRESTAPQAQAKERERPLTRSRANSFHRPSDGTIIMGNASIPPEPNSIKKQEFSFPKEEKEVVSPINLPTQDLTPQDPLPLAQTTRKIMPKAHPQSEPTPILSPYTEIRKSYRKSNKRQVLAFPYRRCHDPLQGRITGVLNKLTGERQCKKEMEGLADRIPKAGAKDIRNKYFVAGVRMVLRMAKERQKQGTPIDTRVLGRLHNEEKALQARISQQLSDFSQWVDSPSPSPLQDSSASSYHALVIKKLYSIMKRSHPGNKCEDIKRRVVSQCRGFFSGEVSISEMVKFLRKRMEI